MRYVMNEPDPKQDNRLSHLTSKPRRIHAIVRHNSEF